MVGCQHYYMFFGVSIRKQSWGIQKRSIILISRQILPNRNPTRETSIALASDQGPFRCNRCKAYVNAFFTWHNGGKEAICCLR